ncbi:conserved Plasmodium protein, unknown function [Plasmodium malariae]|uniref:B box-type domain-containing protein n=1 Tax=Plasmodium malariae TaxID=5858 RepID=A0A1C3KYV6_PLAMA|nr:conserved Plasmodium protein, unknown function [Plasmodium malariae]
MNDKIVIREPLFIAPSEHKSNVLKYENYNFNNGRNDTTNLMNHISISLPYQKNDITKNDENRDEKRPLDINEKENMNCFVNKKNGNFDLKNNEKNMIKSYIKGEINTNYNIIDNMYDVYYTNKSNKNLNEFLKHININHTAPCIGEFRTCMNCFLNISTLFCKTCNLFLCAICNIQLHKNSPDHVINVASSGLYENNYKFNDIILKEKNKWLVELGNGVPIKIREKCPIHVNEYVKYACKTCSYTLLCSDCLLNDPVHVQNKSKGGESYYCEGENKKKKKKTENGSTTNVDDLNQTEHNNVNNINNNCRNSKNLNTCTNLAQKKKNSCHGHKKEKTQNIVSLSEFEDKKKKSNSESYNDSKSNSSDDDNSNGNPNYDPNCNRDNNRAANQHSSGSSNDIEGLKPGFKLMRGNHEILTLVDAKNEIKEELNSKLDLLNKKSLVLKNTIPALRNIYKYGKIICKNNKRSIRACFIATNSYLEKKKMEMQENLKILQDKSNNFLNKLDKERTNYRSYLEKKRNEIQHMIKLSNRNAGLSLDYYVQKLESFKCLFFTKDNLIDIEKKLEIPHSQIKSEHLCSLIYDMKNDILNSKKNINNISQKIKNEFQYLFNSNTEIPIYPAHFRDFLQKRIFNKERIQPISNDTKKRQQYFHVIPFTDFYMNIEITYQQQFLRKDSLHQKWEMRTVSIRSVYLCIHTHADPIRSDKREHDEGKYVRSNEVKVEEGLETGVVALESVPAVTSVEGRRKETALMRMKNPGNTYSEKGKGTNTANWSEQNDNVDYCTNNDPKSRSCGSHLEPKNAVNNLNNDIESIVSLSNVNIKPFSDPNISNITILEKRIYPYGIELTEYNDKNDLVGYWLLTKKNETEVNALLHVLINIKKNNKSSALIPSFHPKINMNNPFFKYHENNISTVYKHFASNIIEQSYIHQLCNNSETHQRNRYSGERRERQGSIETLDGSNGTNACSASNEHNGRNYEQALPVKHSSLLQYYNDLENLGSSKKMQHLKIDSFITNSFSVSGASESHALDKQEQEEETETEDVINFLNKFTLPKNDQPNNILSQVLRKSDFISECSNSSTHEQVRRSNPIRFRNTDYNSSNKFEDTYQNILASKKTNRYCTLQKLLKKDQEWKDHNTPDVNIKYVKQNLVHEGKHSLPLNLESNFSNDNWVDCVNSGANIVKMNGSEEEAIKIGGSEEEAIKKGESEEGVIKKGESEEGVITKNTREYFSTDNYHQMGDSVISEQKKTVFRNLSTVQDSKNAVTSSGCSVYHDVMDNSTVNSTLSSTCIRTCTSTSSSSDKNKTNNSQLYNSNSYALRHTAEEGHWLQNDLQQNDLQQNDLQQNDLLHNDLLRNDLLHNDLLHNDLEGGDAYKISTTISRKSDIINGSINVGISGGINRGTIDSVTAMGSSARIGSASTSNSNLNSTVEKNDSARNKNYDGIPCEMLSDGYKNNGYNDSAKMDEHDEHWLGNLDIKGDTHVDPMTSQNCNSGDNSKRFLSSIPRQCNDSNVVCDNGSILNKDIVGHKKKGKTVYNDEEKKSMLEVELFKLNDHIHKFLQNLSYSHSNNCINDNLECDKWQGQNISKSKNYPSIKQSRCTGKNNFEKMKKYGSKENMINGYTISEDCANRSNMIVKCADIANANRVNGTWGTNIGSNNAYADKGTSRDSNLDNVHSINCELQDQGLLFGRASGSTNEKYFNERSTSLPLTPSSSNAAEREEDISFVHIRQGESTCCTCLGTKGCMLVGTHRGSSTQEGKNSTCECLTYNRYEMENISNHFMYEEAADEGNIHHTCFEKIKYATRNMNRENASQDNMIYAKGSKGLCSYNFGNDGEREINFEGTNGWKKCSYVLDENKNGKIASCNNCITQNNKKNKEKLYYVKNEEGKRMSDKYKTNSHNIAHVEIKQYLAPLHNSYHNDDEIVKLRTKQQDAEAEEQKEVEKYGENSFNSIENGNYIEKDEKYLEISDFFKKEQSCNYYHRSYSLDTSTKCLGDRSVSFHIDGKAQMIKELRKIQGKVEKKIKKYKLKIDEERKVAPPKKNYKNGATNGLSSSDSSDRRRNMRSTYADENWRNPVPANLIDHVLSQIGSKKIGL